MSLESQIDPSMLSEMVRSLQSSVSEKSSIINKLKAHYESQLDLLVTITPLSTNIDIILSILDKLKRAYSDMTLSEVEDKLKNLKDGKLWTK